MSTKSYCNAIAALHIEGDRFHPAISLNGQTLVDPESSADRHEASAAVERVVAELQALVLGDLTRRGWTSKP